MFDFGKFTQWIIGGLTDSPTTWETYRTQAPGWQDTARQLTGPLVVFWGLSALLLGWIFGNGSGFAEFIVPVVSSVLWYGLGSFIASFLAGKFGGTQSFDQAFAALTFASLPGIIGSVAGKLPYIGFIFSLVGAVWSIVMLWQALPVFLGVPLERRVGHFFATLALSIPAFIVLGVLLGALGLTGFAGNDYQTSQDNRFERITNERRASGSGSGSGSGSDLEKSQGSSSSSNSEDNGAGMFGFGREIDYIAEASEDTYSPPSDGLLEERQVDRTVRYFAAANRLREASTDAFQKLEDNNQEPSLGDLFKGVKGLVSAGTAEMQAVKSGGGNWAEHEWVKRQLFEARLHEDLNETTAHNFRLYEKYEAELKDWL